MQKRRNFYYVHKLSLILYSRHISSLNTNGKNDGLCHVIDNHFIANFSFATHVCMDGLSRCIVACAHLGKGTSRRTMEMATALLLISGSLRNEAVLHSSRTSLVGEGVWYWLVTLHTNSDFTVPSHWDIRLSAPWPIPLIILTRSQPVHTLSY